MKKILFLLILAAVLPLCSCAVPGVAIYSSSLQEPLAAEAPADVQLQKAVLSNKIPKLKELTFRAKQNKNNAGWYGNSWFGNY